MEKKTATYLILTGILAVALIAGIAVWVPLVGSALGAIGSWVRSIGSVIRTYEYRRGGN